MVLAAACPMPYTRETQRGSGSEFRRHSKTCIMQHHAPPTLKALMSCYWSDSG